MNEDIINYIYLMQQQGSASAQANLTTLPSQKEWHASEIAGPDPCNSTIKRISGKQVYLKEKPQALILLQAAEIERLNAYLNDYKCKYRSLTREPLDRNSYQVQIKQLFERDATNKAEIDRLNQIILTSAATSQQNQNQLFSAQEKNRLALAERDALGQRTIALQRELQNTRDTYDRYIKKSSGEIHSLNSQLDSHKTYTESVLKNNNELVSKVNTLPQYERRIFELQTQLAFYLEQTQRLNKEIEGKSEKLINQERGYSNLYERHKNLQNSHDDLKNELASKLKAAEQSKVLVSRLLDESDKVKALHDANVRDSTLALAKRNENIDSLARQLTEISLKSDAEQKNYDSLRKKYASLEEKYALTLQEHAKQSDTIKRHQEKISKYDSEIGFLQQSQAKKEAEWQVALDGQRSQLKLKYTQLLQSHQKDIEQHAEIIAKREKEQEELTKTNHHLEKSLHVSKGQLKLSQQIIKSQEAENDRLKRQEQELRSASAERDSLASAIKDKNTTIAQLQKTLKQEREKQAELAAKSGKLHDEHEELKKRFAEENISLNKMINNKVTESESLKKQLISNEADLRAQFQANLQTQNKAHAQKIAKFHKEKQEIVEDLDGLKAQHSHLKTKHAQIANNKSQIQKSHAELSSEYQALQAKNKELQKVIEEYSLKINELTKVGDLLKVHYDQASSDNQKLLSQLNQKQAVLLTSQNEKQKQRQELLALLGKTIRYTAEKSCYDMQLYELKQQKTSLNKELTQLREEIAQRQSQIAKIKEERERLSNLLQGKTKENEGLKRKMIELQQQLKQSFETALKEKEAAHSKAYQLLSQQKEGLSNRISSLEPQLAAASDLQRQKQLLEASLKTIAVNHDAEKVRSSSLSQQNKIIRKALVDKEAMLNEYYREELALKDATAKKEAESLRAQIDNISKQRIRLQTERDALFATLTQYQAKITLLSQEVARLHTILDNNISQSKTDLQLARTTNAVLNSQITIANEQIQQAKKREAELSAMYTLISKKVTVYQSTIDNIRSELVAIQLMTGQLKQERDLLIKKNIVLVKSIRTLSNELDNLEREGDSIAAFFTKDSSIHKQLTSRFTSIQDLLNQLETQKIIVEEKTIEVIK